jgi:hypothetical protein
MKTLILIGLFLYTTFAIGACSAPSPSERAGVRLFFNPNNGTFTINYNLVNVASATILVEDITGKLIYSMGLEVSANTLNLNLMDLVNGIYFVKIKNNDAIISVNKVIINN